ncbi:MAG TPA: efflux RND transporter periplasmic adaptor subunit [Steroidobacteraceae bacterium]|jgi:membrane fusion protein (multidrug efflux system)
MKMSSFMFSLAAAIAVAGCSKQAPPAPPPPEVQVVAVEQRDEPIYSEWIGTLDGFVNAEIRPKVEGYLLKELYTAGAYVTQGTPLFEIDPRQPQASLDQATGNLARAQAMLEKTQNDVRRYTPLAADKAISQQELDNARSAEQEATANVAATRASLQQARLNLDWTRVTSPISGVVGIAKSQVGDLVNSQTVMTTVSQVDPIKVNVNISEQEYLRYAKLINQREARQQSDGQLELELDDGSIFPQKGSVISVDRQVDVRTGTIAVRGSFPNPGNILRPGQYARVRMALETKKGAILVPQRAVNELQGSFQVGVVGADGKADIRVVEPGARIGSLWIINKGLMPGDKVIVEGLSRVRAGQAVVVKPAASQAATAPAAP